MHAELNMLASTLSECILSPVYLLNRSDACTDFLKDLGVDSTTPIANTFAATLALVQRPLESEKSMVEPRPTLAADQFSLASVSRDWIPTMVNKPATPTFTPRSGILAAGQAISIAESTPGAVVYYAVGKVQSAADFKLYSGPLALTTSQPVTAVAVNAGVLSSIASLQFVAPPVSVTVAPSAISLSASQVQTFAASVTGTSNSGVTWSLSPAVGAISAAGVYAAPASITAAQVVTLTATSIADTSKQSSAVVKLTAGGMALAVSGSSVAAGQVITGTLTLTQAAGAGGVIVSLTSSSSQGSVSPSSLLIAPGQTTGMFTVRGNSSGNFSIAAVAGGYGTANSQPITIQGGVPGTTYYVSNTGDDSNPGTSALTPWKSIAKVNSFGLKSGDTVLLSSSGIWHEELDVPSSNLTIGAYGLQRTCTLNAGLVATCANMPILDGADIVTGWNLQSGATYQAAYTSLASKGFVDAVYAQAEPLTLVANLGAVNSTPGSIYADGKNVYVHLLDGSTPASHTIEVSGSRKYGIWVSGFSHVSVSGVEIVRTAKSGYLNYAYSGTGSGNLIQDSVTFNTGDTLSDPPLGGPIESAILSIAGAGQAPPTGFVASGNWIGRMDVIPANTNFTWAGIQADGMDSALIVGNRISTVNGWGIRVQDWFTNNPCLKPLIASNETVNSEGNVAVGGCPSGVVAYNYAHDSFGNFLQLGYGINPNNLDSDVQVKYNTFSRLKPAYLNMLYNGIDVNFASNLMVVGNNCSAVANDCLTLEADAGPSRNATVLNNTFDASQNVSYIGGAPSQTIRVYPFYIRDTSLAGGLTMQGNTMMVNTASPYIKYGALSASDMTHDVSPSQFDVACPNCESNATH